MNDKGDSSKAPGPLDKSNLDPSSLHYRVVSLLEEGKKIEAIKLLRAETGVGLKEAKDAVDEIARQYGIAGAGCGLAVTVFLVGLSLGLALA